LNSWMAWDVTPESCTIVSSASSPVISSSIYYNIKTVTLGLLASGYDYARSSESKKSSESSPASSLLSISTSLNELL